MSRETLLNLYFSADMVLLVHLISYSFILILLLFLLVHLTRSIYIEVYALFRSS